MLRRCGTAPYDARSPPCRLMVLCSSYFSKLKEDELLVALACQTRLEMVAGESNTPGIRSGR